MLKTQTLLATDASEQQRGKRQHDQNDERRDGRAHDPMLEPQAMVRHARAALRGHCGGRTRCSQKTPPASLLSVGSTRLHRSLSTNVGQSAILDRPDAADGANTMRHLDMIFRALCAAGLVAIALVLTVS